jgi:Tfp pilus assembly PilM family ATPase
LNTALGISFSSNTIYFTELIQDDSSAKIEHTESTIVDFNFENELGNYKSSQKDLSNIAGEINTYIAKRNLNVKSASVSISSSQCFCLILPLDYSEGKQSVNSKIYWELSNYFPDTFNQYHVYTYRLNNVLPCKYSDDYLIIAVHKNTIEFIKRIFKLCSLEIKLIDIDHFSSVYSLKYNYYNDLMGRKVLILGLKNTKADFGYIDNAKYKAIYQTKFNNETEFNLVLTKKLKNIFNLYGEFQKPEEIFIYGDNIEESTLEQIYKTKLASVSVINPFENIAASDMFLKNDNLRKIAYKFTSSCGAALRILEQFN